tara:strand:+ start:124453 stop:127143 length:2691 start_codon:yes stop_codon:yes gene_type:complete
MKRISTSMAGGFLAIVTFVIILFACSTEKNTFINRTYHSTTARYNGYFNAKELVRQGLEDYRESYREDFNQILPIELLPNEEDVTEFYPIVDTAISKCQKVISKHSMPTASKPSQKKTEYANWIDQNWLMIGRSNYIRRDYEKALKNFEYVRKFYEGRSSTYTGQLWEAKTQIKLGDLTEAGRTLQKLDQRVQIRLTEQKDKKSKSKILRKKEKDEDESPELPKDFEFELAKVKAMLALEKEEYKKATKSLQDALKKARKKDDKARIAFIIGQLMQKQNNPEARNFYTLSIRKNAPFEMSFNARINRAVVSDLDDDQMIKELEDMAKEEKYLEFRDQIYYAMAQVELGRNQVDEAKKDLSSSVFFSLNNPRQKGVSYEKLGDLSFQEKNYVYAQKYYDSSAQVIPDTYHNAEAIRNKAEKLADLVDYIDLIAFEDSVQRIAQMDEKSRDKFLKDVVKQLKEEEEERKRREAEKAAKMRELQQSYMAQNQGRGNKWYFSNPKAMQEGVEEFRRIWGQRENEDYWRLSNKPSHYSESMNDLSDTTTVQDSTENNLDSEDIAIEDLTPEILMKDIPLSDSAMDKSNERLLEALYNSGMIYKEQLDEVDMGVDQFKRVLEKDIENKHNLLSAFQLYKVYDERNSASKTEYESYILNNYPNSDYANYLRDPDYFIKKKERDALAQKEYLKSVERFERGLFYPVILKAKKVIAEEPDNVYRKEYFLLQAMAMGHINKDKTSLLPVLNQAIEEYPDTRVAERSQEMIDLINNGVPPFEPFSSDASGLFKKSKKDEFFVLLKLDKGESINDASRRVDNFNKEFFSRARLETKSQIYDKDVTFIKSGTFSSQEAAKNYIKDFKKTRKHLGDLRTNEILFISQDNFKTMLREKALDPYTAFFEDNY